MDWWSPRLPRRPGDIVFAGIPLPGPTPGFVREPDLIADEQNASWIAICPATDREGRIECAAKPFVVALGERLNGLPAIDYRIDHRRFGIAGNVNAAALVRGRFAGRYQLAFLSRRP